MIVIHLYTDSSKMGRISWCGKVSLDTDSLMSATFFTLSWSPCDEPITKTISFDTENARSSLSASSSLENCLPSTHIITLYARSGIAASMLFASSKSAFCISASEGSCVTFYSIKFTFSTLQKPESLFSYSLTASRR